MPIGEYIAIITVQTELVRKLRALGIDSVLATMCIEYVRWVTCSRKERNDEKRQKDFSEELYFDWLPRECESIRDENNNFSTFFTKFKHFSLYFLSPVRVFFF